MASSHIKVSQQGLTSAITRILQAKEEYDHAIQVMETTIRSLDSVWAGDSQLAMKEKFESKRTTFKLFSEEIEQYANDIRAYRDDVAERDGSLAAQISSSSY